MNKLMPYKLLLLTALLVPNICFSKVKRISDKEMDLSRPNIIYMTPGRSTLIDYPCEISHSILGLNEDVKVTIGPDSKRTMSVWLAKDSAQPTNLTVKCGNEVYVFDIYPNRYNHQDYVNIVDSFDGRAARKHKLVDSSDHRKTAKKEEKMKLLDSSSSPKKNLVSDNKILRKLNFRKKPKKLLSQGVHK